MEQESDHDKVIRLEEKLEASAMALKLAEGNSHAIRAEVISVIALIIGAYALFYK